MNQHRQRRDLRPACVRDGNFRCQSGRRDANLVSNAETGIGSPFCRGGRECVWPPLPRNIIA